MKMASVNAASIVDAKCRYPAYAAEQRNYPLAALGAGCGIACQTQTCFHVFVESAALAGVVPRKIPPFFISSPGLLWRKAGGPKAVVFLQ
jgi:hypothetical protein